MEQKSVTHKKQNKPIQSQIIYIFAFRHRAYAGEVWITATNEIRAKQIFMNNFLVTASNVYNIMHNVSNTPSLKLKQEREEVVNRVLSQFTMTGSSFAASNQVLPTKSESLSSKDLFRPWAELETSREGLVLVFSFEFNTFVMPCIMIGPLLNDIYSSSSPKYKEEFEVWCKNSIELKTEMSDLFENQCYVESTNHTQSFHFTKPEVFKSLLQQSSQKLQVLSEKRGHESSFTNPRLLLEQNSNKKHFVHCVLQTRSNSPQFTPFSVYFLTEKQSMIQISNYVRDYIITLCIKYHEIVIQSLNSENEHCPCNCSGVGFVHRSNSELSLTTLKRDLQVLISHPNSRRNYWRSQMRIRDKITESHFYTCVKGIGWVSTEHRLARLILFCENEQSLSDATITYDGSDVS